MCLFIVNHSCHVNSNLVFSTSSFTSKRLSINYDGVFDVSIDLLFNLPLADSLMAKLSLISVPEEVLCTIIKWSNQFCSWSVPYLSSAHSARPHPTLSAVCALFDLGDTSVLWHLQCLSSRVLLQVCRRPLLMGPVCVAEHCIEQSGHHKYVCTTIFRLACICFRLCHCEVRED